ncbi:MULTISPECIES: carboxypeptidase-like regulatory domain-containing protein [Persicobacter]|uniref:Carboxypeptidase regulatory-like domain-containing protein n=1 Tax=Persicobacter diffluens TaxID=981 RepID=A0AAN4VWL0_9BACT|nr:carboxypeptidase-like regulatory domain-containing protein [Persicobacter sp. CCB-QB2]GJM61341.1 hypothetical protein PEDI_18930 [Persicobacter diffluens]
MKKLVAFFALFMVSVAVFAQIVSTQVKITVLDKNGNPVKGASVTLYANEKDYDKNENPVQETQTTDEKGRVAFKKLNVKKYWVRAEKGEASNYWGADYIEKLKPKTINKVNLIIE